MLAINQATHSINKIVAFIAGLLIFGIVVFTCLDVFSSVVYKPIPAAIEIMLLLLPWVIGLGMAYGLNRGIHVRVSLLTNNFSKKNQLVMDVLAHLIGCLFFCTLTYGAWQFFWASYSINEITFAASLSLPWWVGKFALPFSMFLIAIQHFVDALEAIRSITLLKTK